MTEKQPAFVVQNVAVYNKAGKIRVGVVGPNGLPAFNTNIPIPREVFSSDKEQFLTSDHEFILYKPLLNDARCHRCHNPKDKTRGMIVIKTSMVEAEAEISTTAKRLLLFAFFLGLTSEIFLLLIVRKTILAPLEILNKGSEFLRAGKLDHRIDITNNDEFGALGQTFNQMASSLEKSHENLERSVQQKTNELRVIAELSSEVFTGDRNLHDIIDQFLDAITKKMGYGYVSLCFVDRETGMLSKEHTKGFDGGFCSMEIALTGDHPFAKAIMGATPSVKKCTDIDAPGYIANIAVIPVLSHQRKRCREINLCGREDCPAFDNADERCWLVQNTLCQSPQSVAGQNKIYGCLHCIAFPVLGVLIAGTNEEIAGSSLHSLEILSSVIASAIENNRLIESKKENIASLIRLHDTSIEKSSPLNMPALTKSIVESAISFAGMHTAVLWLKKEGCLHLENTFSRGSFPEDSGHEVAEGLLPMLLPLDGSFPGQCITEKRSIETRSIENMASLGGFITHYGFRYAVAVPLKFKGSVSGCLTLFKKNDFFMTDSEKAIILLFAGQSAAAINNSKLFSSLKTEKEFSEAIFNRASSGTMVVGAEGTVLKINDAGAEILRTRPGNIIGKKLLELIPGSEPMLFVDEVAGKEIMIRVPDGPSFPVGFSNSYVSDPAGGKGEVIILFKDLSEIKRLQAGIRKKEYFETMEKVISGVAHEVRNPLFGISSVGHILASELVTPQHQSLVKAMLKETARMQRLIEELLLYTRPSKLLLTDVDLGKLMEELRHSVDSEKMEIILSITIPSMIVLRVDRGKITQVLVNLITNALDAAKSTVTVTAGTSGGLIEIMVADDGSGIPPENLGRIFDPFFTTKRGGTGLGLSICKKIVEDHGGRIEVKSTEGKGTVVTLTFME